MTAVAELSFLLFAFIGSVPAQEPLTILEEKSSYTFKLPKNISFCLISRFVGEQKLVLWNTSEPYLNNITVPEDLKQHYSLVDRVNISSNTIQNLTHSDSGLYQVKCFTEANMTHEENSSVVVCSRKHEIRSVQGSFGRTVYLQCEEAADNSKVEWLKRKGEQGEEWTRVSSAGNTSVLRNEDDRLQVVKGTSALRVSNFSLDVFGPYTCLVMDKQLCISSHPIAIIAQSEVVYRSVGESAVLHCNASFSNEEFSTWISPTSLSKNSSDIVSNFTEQQKNVSSINPDINQDYSLVFSSLSIINTGVYICIRTYSWKNYLLVVCPKFGPPAVEYFSEGDEVTFRCNHSLGKDVQPIWFMKTEHVEDTIVKVNQFSKEKSSINRNIRNHINLSLSYDNVVLSNMSVIDSGEYWCAVVYKNSQCIFTAKTLLIYREPLWMYFLCYAARSLLLAIPCVVVVTVIRKARRIEQHSDV